MIVLALVLSAFAVGLDNFAAAIGIGIAGVDTRTRVRVAVIFGFFEAAMPLVGLLIGHSAAHGLGQATRYLGGGLLAAAGLWSLVEAHGSSIAPEDSHDALQRAGQGSGALVMTGLALSIDNLVIGFGLGVTKTPLVASLLVFGLVSVGLSLAGLELGRTLGARMQERADWVAGVVLIAVGALIAANVF
ncbi:MAG TPA: manganese efflux pump [Acidothermaceae bacterium]|nr:manganese efflux pump [Acidothermaceae bacterium]